MLKHNLRKKILIILILLVLTITIFITPVIINNNYKNTTIEIFEKKTNLEINYLNLYNNYYIVKTDSYLLVYNYKYEEIYKEPIDKIFDLNYDIIYKSGTLLYEETIITNKKVTYNYYDIHKGKKTDTLEIEAK